MLAMGLTIGTWFKKLPAYTAGNLFLFRHIILLLFQGVENARILGILQREN